MRLYTYVFYKEVMTFNIDDYIMFMDDHQSNINFVKLNMMKYLRRNKWKYINLPPSV